jgi:hypothetical protein
LGDVGVFSSNTKARASTVVALLSLFSLVGEETSFPCRENKPLNIETGNVDGVVSPPICQNCTRNEDRRRKKNNATANKITITNKQNGKQIAPNFLCNLANNRWGKRAPFF